MRPPLGIVTVMPAVPDPSPTPTPARWAPFLGAISARSVGVTVALGLLVAVVLNPIFMVPFASLLGRTLSVAVLLLLVYAAARQWAPRRLPGQLPPWMWPVLAVALAAPVGTLLVYLLAVSGDLESLVLPARLWGIAVIASCGMVLGLLAAVGAGVRERLAQARSRELQFELERSQLEKQAVDARLALLQAQIEPHFLFNTLANVQALVESGSPQASRLLTSLIAYLRAAMPRLQQGAATLAHEITLVRAYLELMQMRMPDRLRFTIDVDPALAARPFPAMALLTLVENAVRHGLDPLEDGGSIHISASCDAQGCRIAVTDTGAGMNPKATPGTGLTNLRERLAGLYGGRARLELEEQTPHGLRAEIVLPAAAQDSSP